MTSGDATDPHYLLILGVRHSDRRVPSLIDDIVDVDADFLFHESPEGESSTLRYISLTLLKNPLSLLFGISRLSVYFLSNLLFAIRMILSGNAGDLTLIGEGQAQGRRGVKRLSEAHEVEWRPVDVTFVERSELIPWHLSLLSWLSVGFLLLTFPKAVTGSFSWMVAALGGVSFATTMARRISDVRRPARDRRMVENILGTFDENGGCRGVLVTGENHVPGVASSARTEGVEYDAYWLSSTADIEEKAD